MYAVMESKKENGWRKVIYLGGERELAMQAVESHPNSVLVVVETLEDLQVHLAAMDVPVLTFEGVMESMRTTLTESGLAEATQQLLTDIQTESQNLTTAGLDRLKVGLQVLKDMFKTPEEKKPEE